jgi:hypothetical protein
MRIPAMSTTRAVNVISRPLSPPATMARSNADTPIPNKNPTLIPTEIITRILVLSIIDLD